MNDCKYCGGECPEHVDKNGNPNQHTCKEYRENVEIVG
jgi:sulfatase maturation enzyme AslB (radical SAM superfamily)